jgi:phospholipase/lecithinase/hemolysin
MKLFLFFLLIYLTNVYNKQINITNNNLDYTTVVTFGDSLSDTGNAYRISNHTWPPVPPFNSNGGYADDLLWNQIFTQQLLNHSTLQDFSYGSATTDSQLVQGTMNSNPNLVENYSIRNNTKPPGVRQQISEYINARMNENIDFDLTLYVIWVGINNYHFNKSSTPLQTVQSIV